MGTEQRLTEGVWLYLIALAGGIVLALVAALGVHITPSGGAPLGAVAAALPFALAALTGIAKSSTP